MTEEEKGAPVWGEEPVKQSGEDEGLPGKAAPAAGAAAPEMGGTSQAEEAAPAEAGEEAPAKEAEESREGTAPLTQESPENRETAGSEEGLPGKAASAAGTAAPEMGGAPQAEEAAPAEAGEEAPAKEAEESREGAAPAAQEAPETASSEEGLPGKAASAAGAAAPEMGGAPQAAPYGQAPWQHMPQGPAPWQGYPGYGAGQPGAYPGYGAPQQGGYQAPQGYYMPQNGYGYPAQGGYPQQPMYGQQGGYPYGQQPYYGGQPGYAPYGAPPVPPQPRKKLPLGLKVFLWVASILAAGAVLGFAIYLGYSASTGTGAFQAPYEDYLPELPYEDEEPGESQAQEETEEELPPLPEVDVTPNDQSIQIEEKPEGEAMDAQAVYDKVAPSTVTVTVRRDPDSEKPDSTGTGIIATADGYIITNAHVVLHSKSVYVKVTTYDGQEYDAVVVGSDRTTDLAVIKTNDYGFTPAQFGDADELSIGEWVLAIGNPGGERFSSSLTRGIISGLDREVGEYSENGMTYIQTDAAINPGNSGGPLVNMHGQVVGINSSKIMTEGYEGMGFAIPVSTAKNIIDQLLAGGYVEGRVRLGIMGREIDGTMAMIYGLPQGFMISELPEDSAFAGTEAQVGDVITAIDGNEVTSLSEISNLLLRYSPGDQVTVTLFRQNDSGVGGEEIDVTITLLEDRGETQE